MASLNKVFLIGRLGMDPDLKTTTNWNIPVCHFSLATNDYFKDKNTGKEREETEWHNIVAWGSLAEICKDNLKKGNLVHIEGKLKTKSWEDRTTQKKQYKTEIEVVHIQFLERKS